MVNSVKRGRQPIPRSPQVLICLSATACLSALCLPITIWLHLGRVLIAVGVAGLFLCPALCLLCVWQMSKYSSDWRCLVALTISILGTTLGWGAATLFA